MGSLLRALGKGLGAAASGEADRYAQIRNNNMAAIQAKRLAEIGVQAEEAEYQRDQRRKKSQMDNPDSVWNKQRKSNLEDVKAKLILKNKYSPTVGKSGAVKPIIKTITDDQGNETLVQIMGNGTYVPLQPAGGSPAPGNEGEDWKSKFINSLKPTPDATPDATTPTPDAKPKPKIDVKTKAGKPPVTITSSPENFTTEELQNYLDAHSFTMPGWQVLKMKNVISSRKSMQNRRANRGVRPKQDVVK